MYLGILYRMFRDLQTNTWWRDQPRGCPGYPSLLPALCSTGSYLLPTIMSQTEDSQPTSSPPSAKSESAALHQYQDDEGHFSLVRYSYFLVISFHKVFSNLIVISAGTSAWQIW
jgi:hypothetical protein